MVKEKLQYVFFEDFKSFLVYLFFKFMEEFV